MEPIRANTQEDVRRAMAEAFGLIPKTAEEPEQKKVPQKTTDGDKFIELPIQLLDDYPEERHRFRPYTDEQMAALKDSVHLHGIMQPLIVRKLDGGRYQIIAGRNRRKAAVLNGYTFVPCIIRELDDDEAHLQMLSTNLQQREGLLPSEKAWAYRDEQEIFAQRGWRSDLSVVDGEDAGEDDVIDSMRQIRRYIRLTYLSPELLDMVDAKKLGLRVGEELSYMEPESQRLAVDFFAEHKLPLTVEIAETLHKLENAEPLTRARLEQTFLAAPRQKQIKRVKIELKEWRKYFPKEATEQEVVSTIEKALNAYFGVES